MRKIKFSHDYAKLNQPLFTTVRRWEPGKEKYYQESVGSLFLVESLGKPRGTARLWMMTRMRVSDMPAAFLDYDTNHGLYILDPKMDAIVLLFVWEDRLLGPQGDQ